METINYLLGYKDLKIYQDSNMFSFSLDSVMLANFVTLNKNIKQILDIGCGNAPIPLILSTKTKAEILGVDIQSEVCSLANKSVTINNLSDQIKIINSDIKEYAKNLESDIFDVITCNPPYFCVNDSSNLNDSVYKQRARHELDLDLNDIFLVAKKLLKNGGVIAIVHRCERLIDIIMIMRQNNIEPKRIQFVYPKHDIDAKMLLIEGKKNGRPGLKILTPLYAHNSDGSYTETIKIKFTNN